MASKIQASSPDFMESREVPEVEPEEVPTCVRKVSLVERIELGISTSRLSPNAIILGDIDNDPTAVRQAVIFQPKIKYCLFWLTITF